MSFLLNIPPDASLAERKSRYEAYRDSVESARGRLPVEAAEFALAEWHYDPRDPRCPHDAWLETLSIHEPATGERCEIRDVEIRIVLLGAYHDGHIHLVYPGVRHYSLLQTAASMAAHCHGAATATGSWTRSRHRTRDVRACR